MWAITGNRRFPLTTNLAHIIVTRTVTSTEPPSFLNSRQVCVLTSLNAAWAWQSKFNWQFKLLAMVFVPQISKEYMQLCVCVCPHFQPPHGRLGNTSSACLMMWLMAASLSLTMWWRPGGVRGPLHWSCKPTAGIHHTYASYVLHKRVTNCCLYSLSLAQDLSWGSAYHSTWYCGWLLTSDVQ